MTIENSSEGPAPLSKTCWPAGTPAVTSIAATTMTA
jgi:hypothetical protein